MTTDLIKTLEGCGCDETYCDKHFLEAEKEYAYLKGLNPVWVLNPKRIEELNRATADTKESRE